MNIKFALCMIGRDREKEIIRALNSTDGVFDLYVLQDTGSKDKTLEAFENWCKAHKKEYITSKKFLKKDYKYVVVNGIPILGDFATARNDSFKLARDAGADYAFWFDTDDVLVNASLLRGAVEQMNREKINMCIMTYIYAKGDGNIKPVVQKRERIIDLHISGHWRNRVHEVYEPLQPTKLMEFKDCWIEHERTGEIVLETGRRNHLIMKAMEDEEGIESFTDAMLNNYAYDYWEHKEYDESIKYYKMLIDRKSVSGELLFQIFIKMARAYIDLNDLDNATIYANKALRVTSDFGDPYLILAEVYTNLNKWDEAIYFADKVLNIKIPETTVPINEYEYYVIPRRIKINAYLQMGSIEKALNMLNELININPDENTIREKHMLEGDLKRKEAIIGINNIVKFLQDNNKMQYADRLIEAIPIDLLDDQTVRNIIKEAQHDFKIKTSGIKLSGKKSIVFYAGGGVIEPWDGETDIKKGIGGSEGMCIQLSRELAGLGNKVIVYNDCGNSSGKYFNGVLYEDHNKWSPEMKCDVFVSLRRPDVFQRLIKAKKQYLWLHDTGYGEMPKSLFYAPTKIIVLSQAHKKVIKESHGITDDNIFWVSRNGLNPIALEYAEKNREERDPYLMIYASSYDRGLDNALETWHKVEKEVPQARLNIFYGWNTFDKLMEARLRNGEPHGKWMQDYKSKMVQFIASSKGVTEIGKVSQNDLYKEFAQSSIWYYPTKFYEISCINAMTAQALGCVPLCTPYAALNETVSTEYGIKIPLNQITDALIYYLKNLEELDKRRKPMMEWARKAFDIKLLAKEWDEQFNG